MLFLQEIICLRLVLYHEGQKASLKMDGSPAVVWGTNPATGNFFVGTRVYSTRKRLRLMRHMRI